MLKKISNTIGKKYIWYTVKKLNLPQFKSSINKRYHLLFHGKVQGVGLRYEASLLAKKLNLTGKVKNLKNSRVEAQIQGEEDKLNFFISFFENHGRIEIDKIIKEKLPIKENEKIFEIIK